MDIYAARDIVMPSLWRFVIMFAFAAACVAATTWDLTSTSMSNALASFDGGKFMFSHSPGLYVCEKSVQQQAMAVPADLLLNAATVQMRLGSLDGACVRAFGVHSTAFDLAQVHRSTTFATDGDCLVYLFSPSDVYCVGRSDGRATKVDLIARIGARFALWDVTVYNSSLIVTYARQGEMSSAIFRLDGLQSGTLPFVSIAGLLMFARGRPEFYLGLDGTGTCVYLLQLDCGSGTLDRTCLSNNVNQIFSSRVMLSSRNTFLDGSGSPNFIVFATAAYASGSDGRMSVFVYVSSLDLQRFTDSDRAMAHRVYRLSQTQGPVIYTELYENIEPLGEAVLSAAWWNESKLVLGVAVETDGRLLQFPRLTVSVDSLALSGVHLSDLLYEVQAPFVQLAGAIVSGGKLHTCLSCRPTSEGRGASGFFAFGASPVQFRRLLPCAAADTYVDDSTWGSTPVQTCAALANTSELASRVPVFVMTLQGCQGAELEVVLTLATGAGVKFNELQIYVAGSRRRVLLQVVCKTGSATLYDEYLHASGLSVRLSYGILELSGGVDIESVRSVARSGIWRRRLALSSISDAVQLPHGFLASGSWQQHALVVQSIRARQPIFVHVRRPVSLAKLAQDMHIGEEAVTKVALDVLSVTPVLSEPAIRAPFALFTVVYVPSAANLDSLGLAALASGDDRSYWQRVHAAVRLETADAQLGGCEYVARLVAVNDSLWPVTDALPVGCALALPQFSGRAELQVQCHIELPLKLGNNGSFVGLELRALACALPEARALSVELVPFMPISECPPFFFLHAGSSSCVLCAAERCPPGFYVGGCAELIHPTRPVDCLACPAPPHSRFPNTSSTCDAWVCRDGFFQANASACVPCTSYLNSTCREPGTRWAPCSPTRNERCVPCDEASKPRYAQWSNASLECAWRCRDGFFDNGGVCERCHLLQDLRLLLDGNGLRAAGGFYRFRQCTASQQAAFAPCSVSDFSYRLNGTYQADAGEFGTDCALKCTDHERLHLVKLAISDAAGASWAAQKCIECPSWPTFTNGSRLPLGAFEMSPACELSCVAATDFFAANGTRACLWCPRVACPVGSFWSRADNCTRCRPCESRILHANFTGNGGLDDPYSCPEECPPGYFLDDRNTCRQHSTEACVDGLEYRTPGTPQSDAQCLACAQCIGTRESRPCTATGNRECESCGFFEDWNSKWSETGCELLCKEGYTRLTTLAGQLCQKCWPCPRGSNLSETPSTCDCIPCNRLNKVLPQGAFYTDGCVYACPLFHTELHGACRYDPQQASNAVYRPAQVSSVACTYGQRIVQGTGQDSYRLFYCQDCEIPAGLNATDLNATWAWGTGCEWKCVGDLMKYNGQGKHGCKPYYVRRVSATPAVTANWSWADLTGLLGSLMVLLLFSLCLLPRFLSTNKDDEVDEELVTADVPEPVKGGEV